MLGYLHTVEMLCGSWSSDCDTLCCSMSCASRYIGSTLDPTSLELPLLVSWLGDGEEGYDSEMAPRI